ncbi:hypothetical protein MHBO_004129, partial [Bonamia ostreae]
RENFNLKSYDKQSIANEYCDVLGILSETEWGLKYLKKQNIFQKIESIMKPQNSSLHFYTKTEKLVFCLVRCLDYFVPENRDFLKTIFKRASIRLSRQIVCLLLSLYHLGDKDICHWSVQMLCYKLNEKSVVGFDVVKTLEKILLITDQKDILRLLVMQQANFLEIHNFGIYFIIRMAEIKSGYQKMNELKLTDSILSIWKKHNGGQLFVRKLHYDFMFLMKMQSFYLKSVLPGKWNFDRN